MKKIIVLALLLVNCFAFAQVTIKVDVMGLKNNNGQVMIGLYNTENNFLKKIFKGNAVVIKDKKVTTTFANIPVGEYAISVFHDENSNGKLDKNFIGIPTESYASSNGAKGFMGPPKYTDAKFEVNEDKKVVIKM